MPTKPFVYKLIKKNGRLIFKHDSDLKYFKEQEAKLRNGQVIECLVQFDRDDGTLAQLAAVHAMIGTLAREIGDTYSAVKVQTKKDCGLIDLNGNVRSFGDCSKEELNDVREYLIQRGEFCGIQLR